MGWFFFCCYKQTSAPMQCILCINHILLLSFQYMGVWDSRWLTNNPSLTFPNLTAIYQNTHWSQHHHLSTPSMPSFIDVQLSVHQLHHLRPPKSSVAEPGRYDPLHLQLFLDDHSGVLERRESAVSFKQLYQAAWRCLSRSPLPQAWLEKQDLGFSALPEGMSRASSTDTLNSLHNSYRVNPQTCYAGTDHYYMHL